MEPEGSDRGEGPNTLIRRAVCTRLFREFSDHDLQCI